MQSAGNERTHLRSNQSPEVGYNGDAALGKPEPESPSHQSPEALTTRDLIIHLLKAVVGPGSLNLPYVFTTVGWQLGFPIFAVTLAVVIYSCCLLMYCKKLLAAHGPVTYSDVARLMLGSVGPFLVDFCVAVLQGGCLCVFIGFISDSLRAALGAHFPAISPLVCTLLVTLVMIAMVLIRTFKDLTWVSVSGNILMFVSMNIAIVAAIVELSDDGIQPDKSASTHSPAVISKFACSVFYILSIFAFVLPLENAFILGSVDVESTQKLADKFLVVLVAAMLGLGCFIALTGSLCSIAFPDNATSILVYLNKRFPGNLWYSLASALFAIAVVFSFTLQFLPFLEVYHACLARVQGYSAKLSDEAEDFHEGEHWIFHRCLLVCVFALVAIAVPNVSNLISLTGAIACPILCVLPSVIHSFMQWQGNAPFNVSLIIFNIANTVFCIAVGVFGCISSVQAIISPPSAA